MKWRISAKVWTSFCREVLELLDHHLSAEACPNQDVVELDIVDVEAIVVPNTTQLFNWVADLPD